MQTKRDVTQALRNRLKRVTKERNNLQKLVGWSDGKLDVEELLNERDMFKNIAANSCHRIACLELLLNAVLGRKQKGK